MDKLNSVLTAITDLVNKAVRPYVTVLFATVLAHGWATGKLSNDAFLGVAGMVVGFWFQQREAPKPNGDKNAPAVSTTPTP